MDGELFHSLEWVLEVNADEEDLGMYMCVDTRDTDGNHVRRPTSLHTTRRGLGRRRQALRAMALGGEEIWA